MYPKTRSGFYGRYFTTALELANAMGEVSTEGRPFVPRDVGLAQFCMAGDSKVLSEAQLIASI